MKKIGACIEAVKASRRIEPACISWDELQNDAFKRGFSPVQCCVDGIVLYGELPPREKCGSIDILNECVQILTFILMSIRASIATGSTNGFQVLAINRYLTKPLIWALTYELYLRTGTYIRTTEDLCAALTNSIEINIVRYVRSGYNDSWLKKIANSDSILDVVHDCVENILRKAQATLL